MFQLKPLTKEAIPKALEKAERYRLLNEPAQAESICLDVLQIDPEQQQALVMLLLALTDQFDQDGSEAITQAREALARLHDDYERLYYAGIICERRARAKLHRGGRGSEFMAYERLREAMAWYEEAEAIRPSGNDDALLRWNTCARLLARNANLRPAPDERSEPPLE
jgi:tetratricopeptide (TPR) repeat protein